MAEAKPFTPVKLICGVLYGDEALYGRAKALLVDRYGPPDAESPAFAFDTTDYYEREMGTHLRRCFISFAPLVQPDRLAAIKIETNGLEEMIRKESGRALRAVNIDPGIVSASSLIMATAKDFAHRVPLASGIYAHLELLFTKTDTRELDWTYPDIRREGPKAFFLEVRKAYLRQLKSEAG